MRTRVGFNKLCGVKAADRIGREIAEHGARPMAVLQHTFDIRWRNYTEQALALLIPGLAQVAHLQGARNQSLLELVSKNDVQVVRHLVGAGSDRAGPDARNGMEISINAEARDKIAKGVLKRGKKEAPIRLAPSDM